MDQNSQYLLVAALVLAYVGWRAWHSWRMRRRVSELLSEGAAIIDVRSPVEFAQGHADGSLNLPLSTLADAPLSLDPGRAIIVCCASGTRSAMAKSVLVRRGFRNVVNGGSWVNVARGAHG